MNFDRVSMEQFFRTYAISRFDVSQDESQIVLSTNLSGSYDLWSISKTNQYPTRLTTRGQVPYDILISQNHDFIVATFDHNGDENTQIYAIAPNGGSEKIIRNLEGYRFMEPIISRDGKQLYYTSNKDHLSFLAGYRYDLEVQEETLLYVGEQAPTYLAAVGDDGSEFVTRKLYANTYSVAHFHKDGEVTSLTPDEQIPHVVENVMFYNHMIYLTTNYGEDFTYLASFDTLTREFQKLYAAEKADISTFKIDQLHNRLLLTVHGSMEDSLCFYDLKRGHVSNLTCPATSISQVKMAESGSIYLLGTSDTKPSNLYLLETDQSEWTPLTNNRIMGVTQEELSIGQVVQYPSFDGLMIEALLFPANPDTANGYTVVWPHGGPQASERKFYRAFFQYMAYAGYQVFAPNFRGSSGYGAEFLKMVEGDWGHGPRLDMIEGIEWLIQSGKCDRDKLFLVGGSYGGYMTLLLHGRHAEYFKACVDIFGPCNLFTFIDSVPEHWKPMMKQWLGDPIEDRERLEMDSPITYLSGMTKPMLVIQGANDPRVVQAESDQIVEALRAQGTKVEYLVFEDEGHGFTKKENEIRAYSEIVTFLAQYR